MQRKRWLHRSWRAVGAVLVILTACDRWKPTEPPIDGSTASTIGTRGTPTPPKGANFLLVPAAGFVQLSGHHLHTCALRGSGTAACWGSNGYGESPASRTASVGTFTQIEAGSWQSCGLRSDGVVECWGSNAHGEGPPVRAASTGTFTQLATGAEHGCALRDDGVAECWGTNTWAGMFAGQAPPVRAATTGFFRQIDAGAWHTCAVRNDGFVECWGSNYYGQAPAVRAPTTGSFVQVSASSGYFTCAVRNDGVVECWGINNWGMAPAIRAPVTGAFTQVGTGANHTCAVRNDGVVECWGGGGDSRAPPIRVPAVGAFVQVVSGYEYSCALRSDGNVECWGHNHTGEASPPPPSMTHVLPTATFAATPSVAEGSPIALALTGAAVPGHPEAVGFTFAFDCGAGSGYGSFSSTGTASCATSDGPATRPVKGKVRDQDGDTQEYVAAVSITNVAPTATFVVPSATVTAGDAFALALDGATDLSPVDAAAGLLYAFDCGDGAGYAIPASSSQRSCPTTAAGSRTVKGRVSDKDGGATEYTGTVTVVPADVTPPLITPSLLGTLGNDGWYVGTVTVSWTVADPESAVTATSGCGVTSVTTDGTTSLTCTATSTGGTAEQSVTIRRDVTPPVVAVTGVQAGATYTLGQVPAAGCTTTDATSGVAGAATLALGGGTVPGVGLFTATCGGAADRAGNTGAASVSYTVAFPFAGFFPPIDNPPTWNGMNAGRAVPVKFSLGGDHGLDVFAADHPRVVTLACETGAPSSEIEETVTAGGSSLSYDAATGRYSYVWKTSDAWAGSCRQLVVKLTDGTEHRASFRFK